MSDMHMPDDHSDDMPSLVILGVTVAIIVTAMAGIVIAYILGAG